MRSSLTPAAVIVLAASCSLVAVLVCIAFVDRPAATWSHAHFSGHDMVFRGLTHLVDPFLPLAGLGLAGAALAGAVAGAHGALAIS